MNQFAEGVLNHPVMETLGWVLLHSVWQAVAIAIVLFFILLALRRASANARYLCSCTALLGTVLLPAITYSVLPEQEPDRRPTSAAAVSGPDTVSISQASELLQPSVMLAPKSADSVTFPELPPSAPDAHVVSDSRTSWTSRERFENLTRSLRPWIPFLTCAWLAGVLVLSIRLLVSWRHVQRLQLYGVQPARDEFLQLLRRLATRLRIHRPIQLLESVIVEVPTVIGWLKPVILLPVASINSLTVQQLEAILAHELAHIRRADYAVNLVQSLIETLLFYHPAVWWMSARIRQEREHCCDDLATTISGDAVAYVAALVRMEELRCEAREVALAARGGDLMSRVRRLLVPSTPDRLVPRWLTGAVAMLIVAALVGVPLLTKSHAEPATVETSTTPSDETSNTVDEAKNQPATNEKATLLADIDLDEITPAEIADRIEESRKRYASAEYTATIEQTRNTSAFKPDAKPTLVKGTDTLQYRCDGERWYRDHKSFSYNIGSTQTYPIHTQSSFDGAMHRVLEKNVLKLAEEDPGAHQFSPAELFWKGGISLDWLIGALRRPEAKLVERLQMAEMSCLHVTVEWKPEWSETKRFFDLMICPEQGWLVRRARIENAGELMAEWSIDEVAKTTSGLHYPAEFKVIRPETDSNPSTRFTISKFQDRASFEPDEFQVPNPIGIDIVDYRSGIAWHNDPWWNELTQWARENLAWPQPDLRPLTTLQSYSPPEFAGTAAPELMPGEWVNQPGKLTWDRPERAVTVLYFFGGRLIKPTPEQIAALSHLQRKYADGGLEIIGIASHSETPELTRQAVRELVPSFPVMIDAKAQEEDVNKKVAGAEWGANFVRYQLKPYTGTVIVNKAGQVILLNNAADGSSQELSQLETLIRSELLKCNGTSDPPLLRQAQVNLFSRLLRGTAASPEELAAAINDQSPLWYQNAQQAVATSMTGDQRELLESYGVTVDETIQELKSPSMLPIVMRGRLQDEWKKRASAASGNGHIVGRVRHHNGAQLIDAKATLFVEPVLQTLIMRTPGAWYVAVDRSRIRKIETDDSGVFLVDKLPKGSYHVIADAPGKPRAKRKLHLLGHESIAEVDFDLFGGDTISGKVTDTAGKAVPKATIKAVKRFTSSEAIEVDHYTTEDMPDEIQSANDNGDFTFGALFEGAYQFEVSADGFETITTEAIPAGYAALRVILKPVIPDQANVPASRAILGTVIHRGQPVAKARVGLQAWIGNAGPYRNSEAFVATAVTGDDGQYVLTVPNDIDSKSSVAIWAVAEGYQPTRENVVMNVTAATKSLQNVRLVDSLGCVIQISDADENAIANAGVIVPSQTLPESIDFEIPKDWQGLVSGTTNAEGLVSLPYVVQEAMTQLQIQVPGQDSAILFGGNYFLNARPATRAPHYRFKLPKSGSLEGKIEVTGGQLPPDLMLEISTDTASAMTNEPLSLKASGVAQAKVDADGHFKIESIAAGKVTIKPFLPVNQPLRAELPRNIQVVADKITSLAINVVKGVHLRGRIVASDTGNGLAGVRFQILYGTSAQEPQNMHNSIDVVTDDQGHYQVWVPFGRVLLRIGWRDRQYSQVEYWSPRASGLGIAFEVPESEEFELEPITFVPTKQLSGQLVDQNGSPLVNWNVFGFPEIQDQPSDTVMNSFGGTTSDGEGRFSGLYPSTFPPAVWKVSHKDWPPSHESNDRKWIAKVISQEPLILQVNTKPIPPAPLRNAANSGDMTDDEAITVSGLTGTWSLQSMKWNGINVPEEQCRQTTMTIEGHQLTIDKYWNISFSSVDPVTRIAEGGFTAETGLAASIRLNKTRSPLEIDLTINGVGTFEQEELLQPEEREAIKSGKLRHLGLCELQKDTLTLSLNGLTTEADSPRPQEFSADESSERTLLVFHRIKP